MLDISTRVTYIPPSCWRWRHAGGDGFGRHKRLAARPGVDGEVEIVAAKSACRGDPDTVRVRVVKHAGGVTLCALKISR